MNELKSKVQDKYRIVVFDDKKAVFRTHEIDELKEFLLK